MFIGCGSDFNLCARAAVTKLLWRIRKKDLGDLGLPRQLTGPEVLESRFTGVEGQ